MQGVNMGFGSGNASFTRFKIIDEIPGQLWSEISGKLKLFAFQDIDNRPDERFWGWTNIDDMLDTSWQSSPPEKGHYLAFSLRLDTRRIAPAVFKKHYTLALREEEQKAKAEGHAFVSRLRRQELRQAVRQRLLQRSLPIPAEFNVIWNTQNGIVYFASTQAKMVEMFTEHFSKTFELDLEQLTPYTMATNLLGENIAPKLDALQGTIFV